MTRTLIAIALLLVASQLSAQTDFETYKQQQQQKSLRNITGRSRISRRIAGNSAKSSKPIVPN